MFQNIELTHKETNYKEWFNENCHTKNDFIAYIELGQMTIRYHACAAKIKIKLEIQHL